jgi:hypothetical protein
LSFNYYKQYTLGIVAYLITPIFYRLSESNIKELSDKLLVSALRFVDFLFKFHKNSFSWKHLDISPEMLEANRAPELKSVVVDLLNYLAQIHINKSTFSLSEYKFDGLIANEIFAMAKTDEVFSALFSFSLDETLPLIKQYQDLLKETQKDQNNEKESAKYADAVSSLQIVLGDLHYYDDELEEAEVYYKSTIQALRENERNGKMTHEQFYVYMRNMLRLGIIYEKRKQDDFAYQTYSELCELIIKERMLIEAHGNNKKLWNKLFPDKKNDLPEKTTYEGFKMLYLPFIAKLQILEKSHIGGITPSHLEQLEKEFENLNRNTNHEEANILKADFFSRVADILYYKNTDLKCKKGKNRKKDDGKQKDDLPENYSCTACYYYHKALSILLNLDESNKDENTVIKLLHKSVNEITDNYNAKFCTVLARILSDWGNVFFSCDNKNKDCSKYTCYICDAADRNTENNLACVDLQIYIDYIKSEKEDEARKALLDHFDSIIKSEEYLQKMEIAFAMYAISSEAYRNANLYKRSSYQFYKMLCLFKNYEIFRNHDKEKLYEHIDALSENAIHYLWYANENLNVLELNKRKKDFDKKPINESIPLQYLLADSEIIRIKILAKELELKSDLASNSTSVLTPERLAYYYGLRITSPYKINYSIVGRIYQLRLKARINYEAYRWLTHGLPDTNGKDTINSEIEFILEKPDCSETVKEIFGQYYNFDNKKKAKIEILENLIAETIYCLIDIAQLTETMDETYLFPHSFLGAIHEYLSYWIRRYEVYETMKKDSQIDAYLEQYLDEEWREQLSGYRENQQALSHYYKSLEMHSGGRAYHNMINTMCYLKDDYNDRSDHFNIAEERHSILNGEGKGKIKKKIKDLNNLYRASGLYKAGNYFTHE